jgi:hypothetical protein
LTTLRVEDIQQREEHWVIADLIGKGGHIRTIPIPDWVKAGIAVEYPNPFDDHSATVVRINDQSTL